MGLINKTSSLPQKTANKLRDIADWIYKPPPPPPQLSPVLTPEQIRVIPWNAARGDETLRLDYDLNVDSLVFDLGGYKGEWTRDIYCMYGCGVHIFEPVMEYSERIKRRFAKNRKIIVHQFGLANESQMVNMGVVNLEQPGSDQSSIFKLGTYFEQAKLVRAADFLEENNIQFIDLMKINIEGAEYDLMDHLLECGFTSKIRDIQIQFHTFVPDAERRMSLIQESLAKTHVLTYQYPFVWENWHLKNNP